MDPLELAWMDDWSGTKGWFLAREDDPRRTLADALEALPGALRIDPDYGPHPLLVLVRVPGPDDGPTDSLCLRSLPPCRTAGEVADWWEENHAALFVEARAALADYRPDPLQGYAPPDGQGDELPDYDPADDIPF